MKPSRKTTLAFLSLTLASAAAIHAQGPGRGPGGGGGGGGGLPADFQEKIHQLFQHPEAIRRTVDITENGYLATTTTSNPELATVLQSHVKQMSGRLGEGMPVRLWDPAFGEFFAHYDELDHQFKNLKNGIRAKVTAKSAEAVAAAHNHAFIILDFSSQGGAQMHQPHRTVLDEDGGESNRFHGGPPDARAAELAKTFGALATEASTELMQALGGQLKQAMQAGGPEAALPVCKAAAIPLTEGTSKRFDGLTIKRVTDRPRNPENAADKVDLQALKHFRKAAEQPKLLAHLTTGTDGTSVRYYRPLLISDTCLNCHGEREKMSANLRGLIDQLYPDDQAHGYSLGELRGLIRIERAAAPNKSE